MRVGMRGRLALQMTVWAIVGLALLAIPALVATNARNSPTTGNNLGNNTGTTNVLTAQSSIPTSATKTTTAPNAGSETIGNFLARLSLVLALAMVLSSLVMVGLRRRFRKSIR
jgi:preprotein translocase subunit SecG